ncbi:MAG: LysM peptidoglycan-binding domain-containing protein [Anaerolineae bacterium]|nr:LysM peptidoglycan-binding domain-containing protein [Anaerolineae bacterium]
MKRSLSPWPLLLLLSLLTLLVLTACERPARTDTSTTPETTQGETTPIVIPLQETPMGLPELPPVTNETPSGESQPGEGATPEGTVDPNAPGTDPGTVGTDQSTPPATTPSTYTIQSGDTLGRVAERFGLSLQALLAANPEISNPDRVQIGDVINLPGAGSPTTPAAGEERVHRVQAGENLYRIGLLYGCTIAQLAAHNSITNPDRLEIGQEIRIPNCN